MNNTNLEKEFTAVITDITRDVANTVIKKTALESMDKLSENIGTLRNEYDNLLKDIEKYRKTYKDEADAQCKEMAWIRDTCAGENKTLLMEVGKARKNYKDTSGLLMEDIKKSKTLLDDSNKKITDVVVHLNQVMQVWNDTMGGHTAQIEQLSKSIDTLQKEFRTATRDLRKTGDNNYTELHSAIDTVRDASEKGRASLHEEYQSLAGAFSQGNSSLVQMQADNQNALTAYLDSLQQEYRKKYLLLVILTAGNLLGLGCVLWRVFVG